MPRLTGTLTPLAWAPEDVEPWYQHGMAVIDGEERIGEAEFRNLRFGEIVFLDVAATQPVDQAATVVRYVRRPLPRLR